MADARNAWLEFAFALAAFVASHMLPARPKLRVRLVSILGRQAFLIVYSVVSVALALWAFAHLIPNGDLSHVILFGGFGAFAVIGMPTIDRRKRREWGEAEWRRLAGVGAPRQLGGFGKRLALRLAAGLALYLTL